MPQDSEVTKGTEGAPTSDGSQSTTGQRSSATDVEAKISELNSQIEKLTRMVQGDKDRAVKKTNQRLDALEGNIREVLQVAQGQGKSVSDVLADLDSAEEMEARQAMFEVAKALRSGGLQTLASQGSGKGSVDVSGVLSELELDESDVRVKEFRSRQFATEAEAYRAAIALRKTVNTKLSDADTPSDVADTKSASKQEALMREYEQGSKALRGQALINFKMEMRKKGLRSLT